MTADERAAADPRRAIPRTDILLSHPQLHAAEARLGRDVVKAAVREAQQRARDGHIAPEAVPDTVRALLGTGHEGVSDPPVGLTPVVNATGVVLHTNLGRAPLARQAVDAVALAAGYVDVEFDTATGGRARRGRGALDLLARKVPAAGAVHVVNNGAAALVLAATALASGREIIVSRGELVEIGDGFRIPDLLASTGARLREVGTTNRTHLRDYADAIGPDTGFILKIHPSNFRIEGFTRDVPVRELAALDALVVADIGSGLLAPDPLLADEPDAATWLTAGADLVTASGDKLLGGPQAGLLLGERELVEGLRRHPLARALRVDKLTLAALEATLAVPATPTHAALHADAGLLEARARALAARLAVDGIDAEAASSDGAVGGGGAPGVVLPGWAVRVPEAYAEPLRTGRPCVVGRVERGRCVLDLRCVPPHDDDLLYDAVHVVARALGAA
ncbi:L-seryl-tRNA(Sec) selenium transferase [Yinghuangia seranimata]|uniref:L-seryl-tRNA(Sec) selenium transferase n=1 Tax=Yinghuangia seranimata TaxID=408067 RepID=UPI00248B4828|nr:L-seryl-tRNA(Sec) selenium transferase [Yinghuangia seranimata]MDI2131060.1 L-seryl-tRNA(Sec) selenium transferase [Yinghuangia seranimata]